MLVVFHLFSVEKLLQIVFMLIKEGYLLRDENVSVISASPKVRI